MPNDISDQKRPVSKRTNFIRMVGAVIDVAAILALVFYWCQTKRRTELERQYANALGHMGRQVELTFEKYKEIIQNLEYIPYSYHNEESKLGKMLFIHLPKQENGSKVSTSGPRCSGLALFSLPLGKLWWISSRARFQYFDWALLVAAAALAVVLTTLVFGALHARSGLRSRMDRKLRTVGSHVSENVEGLLERSARHLYHFEKDTRNGDRSQKVNEASWEPSDRSKKSPKLFWNLTTGCQMWHMWFGDLTLGPQKLFTSSKNVWLGPAKTRRFFAEYNLGHPKASRSFKNLHLENYRSPGLRVNSAEVLYRHQHLQRTSGMKVFEIEVFK